MEVYQGRDLGYTVHFRIPSAEKSVEHLVGGQ